MRKSIALSAFFLSSALVLTACEGGVYTVEVNGPGVNGSGAITVSSSPQPQPTTPPSTIQPTLDSPTPPTTETEVPTPTPTPITDSAAQKFNWGTPHPSSDEFNYVGKPLDKWQLPGGCWPGHAGNGRRCADRTTVDGTKLVMTGLANGDTGWIRTNHDTRYGRWEIRSRSRNTGTTGGTYHPLHLIWPTSEKWPEDGEYDFLENRNPDDTCAGHFIHYPHNKGVAVQQEGSWCATPNVNLNEWHNYAFEWTPTHVAGFIDGVEVYRYSGGANSIRNNIQDMPLGSYTMQLDNFTGDGGLRPASFEVDWYRFYPLP